MGDGLSCRMFCSHNKRLKYPFVFETRDVEKFLGLTTSNTIKIMSECPNEHHGYKPVYFPSSCLLKNSSKIPGVERYRAL